MAPLAKHPSAGVIDVEDSPAWRLQARQRNAEASPEDIARVNEPFVVKRSFIVYGEEAKLEDSQVKPALIPKALPLAEAVKNELKTLKFGETQLTKALDVIFKTKKMAWKIDDGMGADWATTSMRRLRNVFRAIEVEPEYEYGWAKDVKLVYRVKTKNGRKHTEYAEAPIIRDEDTDDEGILGYMGRWGPKANQANDEQAVQGIDAGDGAEKSVGASAGARAPCQQAQSLHLPTSRQGAAHRRVRADAPDLNDSCRQVWRSRP